MRSRGRAAAADRIGRWARSILLATTLAALLATIGGCGDTSDPAASTESAAKTSTQVSEQHPRVELPASVRRKLHGKAELLNPHLKRVGVAVLGPAKSDANRTVWLRAKRLQPSTQSNYAVWLSATPHQMLMLGTFEVGKGGQVLQPKVRFPSGLTRNLEHGSNLELVLTRTNRARLEAALGRLPSRNAYSPYTGRVIARGLVLGPIVGSRPNLSSITRERTG